MEQFVDWAWRWPFHGRACRYTYAGSVSWYTFARSVSVRLVLQWFISYLFQAGVEIGSLLRPTVRVGRPSHGWQEFGAILRNPCCIMVAESNLGAHSAPAARDVWCAKIFQKIVWLFVRSSFTVRWDTTWSGVLLYEPPRSPSSACHPHGAYHCDGKCPTLPYLWTIVELSNMFQNVILVFGTVKKSI